MRRARILRLAAYYAGVGLFLAFLAWLFACWLVGASNDFAVYRQFEPVKYAVLARWLLCGFVAGSLAGTLVGLLTAPRDR